MALYGIMTGMLITGSANTIINKWQDQTVSDCNEFTHPYLQTLFMFLGEFMCFAFLFAKKAIYGKPKEEGREPEIPLSPGGVLAEKLHKKTKINPLILAIPASCDVCSTTLMFVALTMLPASVY